jgi:ribonuclease P protein component
VTADHKPNTANAMAHPSAADASARFGFPKQSRLLKHSAFQNVYEVGRRHFSTNMTFFYLLRNANSGPDAQAQVGITVGRALGGAVDRNRLKRRFRDLVRHQLGTLNSALAERELATEIVINPKKAALAADHAALRAEVERGFKVIATAKPVNTGTSSAPKVIREESKTQ